MLARKLDEGPTQHLGFSLGVVMPIDIGEFERALERAHGDMLKLKAQIVRLDSSISYALSELQALRIEANQVRQAVDELPE